MSESALTSDPDAEAQEVEVALSLHRVPAEVRVALGHQLAVGLQAAARQVDGDLLQVVLSVTLETGRGQRWATYMIYG